MSRYIENIFAKVDYITGQAVLNITDNEGIVTGISIYIDNTLSPEIMAKALEKLAGNVRKL